MTFDIYIASIKLKREPKKELNNPVVKYLLKPNKKALDYCIHLCTPESIKNKRLSDVSWGYRKWRRCSSGFTLNFEQVFV